MIEQLRADGDLIAAVRALTGGGDVEESLARIAWSVIAEPGDGDAGRLIEAYGAVHALHAAVGGDALLSGGRDRASADAMVRWATRAEPGAVANAIRSAEHIGATLLTPSDRRWPASVDDLGVHAPVVLWVRGDPTLLCAEPRASIVGARASTAYGDSVAAELSADLAAGGAVIVSGAAYGIDGAAHRAALSVDGGTVAFLAGGVDRAYPQGHASLLGRIAERGSVVSEVPCGTAPTKWRFLARNRLIAALSDATVVVEAGWRSGSLNTAGHAAALGRPLGAVPGPVTSAASAGCHRLLREYDAQCVTTAADVRELWGGAQVSAAPGGAEDGDRTRVRDALSTRTSVSAVEVARRSGMSPQRVGAVLGFLELDGEAVRDDGGWRRGRGGR